MTVYIQPILDSLFIFLLISIAIFIPWLIFINRKYGFLSFSKMIIMFSFIFYFISALFLVILPLPDTTNNCVYMPNNMQLFNLRPFQFIEDILRDSGIVLTNPATWIYTIKQPAFYQAFFNFLLLMPLGVYARYFFKKRSSWWKAYLAGLGLSLFYEITQVSGIYGVFDCAYRIFDVDDLLLNSTGALAGFLIAPIILAIFPTHEDVVEKAQKLYEQNIVKPLPILLAAMIDLSIVGVLSACIPTTISTYEFAIEVVLIGIVFYVIPLAWKGTTIGTKVMRFHYETKVETYSLQKGLLRRVLAILVMKGVLAILAVLNQIELDMDSSWYVFQIFVSLGSALLTFAIFGGLIIHIVLVLLKKSKLFIDKVGKIQAKRK